MPRRRLARLGRDLFPRGFTRPCRRSNHRHHSPGPRDAGRRGQNLAEAETFPPPRPSASLSSTRITSFHQANAPGHYITRDGRGMSTSTAEKVEDKISEKEENEKPIDPSPALLNYRFAYPEFLPDPNPLHRNKLREKLERKDMLARRSNIEIPEFYVGSILAVTHSDPHAPGKTNRFLGICIQRLGCGLRANFILRNVIDHLGVEVHFDLYDPTIQKIDVIRLEKRLDEELFYLRDAPPEYSTFPLDMEAEYHPDGAEVPVNEMKVPLKPTPWLQRWERMNMKGIIDCLPQVNEKRRRKAALKIHQKPWEKYDLMKMYRETIPMEEQSEIFAEVHSKLHELELHRHKMKRSRNFVRPKKSG